MVKMLAARPLQTGTEIQARTRRPRTAQQSEPWHCTGHCCSGRGVAGTWRGPGPLSLTDSDTQRAVEALFGERFGCRCTGWREAVAGRRSRGRAAGRPSRERLYRQLLEKNPWRRLLCLNWRKRAQGDGLLCGADATASRQSFESRGTGGGRAGQRAVVASKLNLSATPLRSAGSLDRPGAGPRPVESRRVIGPAV